MELLTLDDVGADFISRRWCCATQLFTSHKAFRKAKKQCQPDLSNQKQFWCLGSSDLKNLKEVPSLHHPAAEPQHDATTTVLTLNIAVCCHEQMTESLSHRTIKNSSRRTHGRNLKLLLLSPGWSEPDCRVLVLQLPQELLRRRAWWSLNILFPFTWGRQLLFIYLFG